MVHTHSLCLAAACPDVPLHHRGSCQASFMADCLQQMQASQRLRRHKQHAAAITAAAGTAAVAACMSKHLSYPSHQAQAYHPRQYTYGLQTPGNRLKTACSPCISTIHLLMSSQLGFHAGWLGETYVNGQQPQGTADDPAGVHIVSWDPRIFHFRKFLTDGEWLTATVQAAVPWALWVGQQKDS